MCQDLSWKPKSVDAQVPQAALCTHSSVSVVSTNWIL